MRVFGWLFLLVSISAFGWAAVEYGEYQSGAAARIEAVNAYNNAHAQVGNDELAIQAATLNEEIASLQHRKVNHAELFRATEALRGDRLVAELTEDSLRMIAPEDRQGEIVKMAFGGLALLCAVVFFVVPSRVTRQSEAVAS